MRFVAVIALLPAILGAQEAREVVVRSIELDRKDAALVRNYTFLQRQVESDLDSAGKPKNKEIRTWDVTLQEGSPYRRLVAPISPASKSAPACRRWHPRCRRRRARCA